MRIIRLITTKCPGKQTGYRQEVMFTASVHTVSTAVCMLRDSFENLEIDCKHV